jgi:hypothetical protein
VTRALVAAGVLLFAAISGPASAQQGRPIAPSGPRPPPPQSDYSQQQPRLCVEIGPGVAGEFQFEWPHDAAGRRICRMFGAPGSYCECKNRFGEAFTGIVQ